MRTEEKAYAKINLSIDIVGKLGDGYHAMRMVMQSVSLCDDVTVAVSPGEGIAVRTNLRYLPNDSRNIAARAAAAFFEATGITGYKTEIDIIKRIPVGAGLGGGSTDGAAALRALNRLFDKRLSAEELEKLAEKVGSDVPFCVRGGTVLAEGRGEKLKPLAPLPDCSIVLCKPAFSVSTPELFSRVRWEKIQLRPDTEGIVRALEEGSLAGVARRMYNVFEDVLQRERDDVEAIRDTLCDHRALGAVMTGTGSAVFGIFDDEAAALSACEALRETYRECFLARPVRQIDI
jgi:4-diphosphocytidyl-2-C-methyl-D-erythritol kinase